MYKTRAYRLIGLARNPMQWLTWSYTFFDWLDIHMEETSVTFEERYELYQHCANVCDLTNCAIDYFEFGVAKGKSLRWWVTANKHPQSRFHGFDSFQGIPEEWGWEPAGSFTTQGELPKIDDERIVYHIGLFQQTLRPFLEENNRSDRPLVIHIDADLYSSTLYVLTQLDRWLRPNDLIIFDEAGAVIGFTHEFRALFDYLSAYRREARLIGGAREYSQLALAMAPTRAAVDNSYDTQARPHNVIGELQ